MPETIHDEDDHQDIEAKSARWIRIHIYTYREGNSSDHFACRSNLQIEQASRLKASVVPFWRRALRFVAKIHCGQDTARIQER